MSLSFVDMELWHLEQDKMSLSKMGTNKGNTQPYRVCVSWLRFS